VGSVIRFRVVTTMNERGWRETGERMVRSFLRNWPAEASLTVYAEGFCPSLPDVAVRRLPTWLDEFKMRHAANPKTQGRVDSGYDYRGDCLKFSHKVAALTDYALSVDDGILVWLDCDVFTHAGVTADWLDSLFPEPSYIAWLDRAGNHPECGFVMYRPGHRSHREFMEGFADFYKSDKVLRLRETHDSYALQKLVEEWHSAGKIEPPVSLSGEARTWHHPLVSSRIGECCDHLKGGRKQFGKSQKRDLQKPRIEPYWTC